MEDDLVTRLEGQQFTGRELVEMLGEPVLYLTQFCGFIKGEYRILAMKQDDGNYKISEVYKR